jgi:SpoVK/Ycf46/Vps4 family AAA+-type ATPase
VSGLSMDGVDLSEVAKRAVGFTGADLQGLLYTANLEAIHELIGDGVGEEKVVEEAVVYDVFDGRRDLTHADKGKLSKVVWGLWVIE